MVLALLAIINIVFLFYIVFKIANTYRNNLLRKLNAIKCLQNTCIVRSYAISLEKRRLAIQRWKRIRARIKDIQKLQQQHSDIVNEEMRYKLNFISVFSD